MRYACRVNLSVAAREHYAAERRIESFANSLLQPCSSCVHDGLRRINDLFDGIIVDWLSISAIDEGWALARRD